MHRIDGDGHAANMFTEGNSGTGVPATQITAPWLTAVQEEIVGVITSTGASLVKANNGQLLTALDAKYGSAVARTWTAQQTFNQVPNVGAGVTRYVTLLPHQMGRSSALSLSGDGTFVYPNTLANAPPHGVFGHIPLPQGATPTALELALYNGPGTGVPRGVTLFAYLRSHATPPTTSTPYASGSNLAATPAFNITNNAVADGVPAWYSRTLTAGAAAAGSHFFWKVELTDAGWGSANVNSEGSVSFRIYGARLAYTLGALNPGQ